MKNCVYHSKSAVRLVCATTCRDRPLIIICRLGIARIFRIKKVRGALHLWDSYNSFLIIKRQSGSLREPLAYTGRSEFRTGSYAPFSGAGRTVIFFSLPFTLTRFSVSDVEVLMNWKKEFTKP